MEIKWIYLDKRWTRGTPRKANGCASWRRTTESSSWTKQKWQRSQMSQCPVPNIQDQKWTKFRTHVHPLSYSIRQKIQWKLAISIHDRLFSVFYFFQRHTLSLIATHTHTHRDTDTQTHSHCQCTNVNNWSSHSALRAAATTEQVRLRVKTLTNC